MISILYRIGCVILLVLTSGISHTVIAQETISADVERYYTTQQGLPGNFIQHIATDHFGRMWIASSNGLALLHGANVVVYRADGSRTSLWSNQISALYFSKKRHALILGFNDGTVQVFDILTNTFSPAKQSNISGSIHSIIEDPIGSLWVSSKQGIAYSVGIESEWKSIALPQSLMQINTMIFSKNRDAILLATEEHGLWECITTSNSARWEQIPFTAETEQKALKELHVMVEYKSSLWIGTRRKGLIQTILPSRISAQKSLQQEPLRSNVFLPEERINACCVDSMGHVWVGVPAKGIMLYSGNRFVAKQSGNTPMNLPSVMMCSPDGTLWIGSQGNGLCALGVRSSQKTNVKAEYNIFARDSVFALSAASTQSNRQSWLWVGTKRGATRYAISVNSSLVSDVQKNKVIETGKSVVAILSTAHGEWLALYGGGIKFIPKQSATASVEIGASLVVTALLQKNKEGNNDTIIVATSNAGIWYLIQSQGDDTQRLQRMSDSSLVCYAIIQSGQEIYIGTKNRGVVHLRTGESLFPSLARMNIYALHEVDGTLFIGTENGLYAGSLDTKQVRLIAASEGLSVVSIHSDRQGKLFCSTTLGVLVYVIASEQRMMIPSTRSGTVFSLGASLNINGLNVFGTLSGDIILGEIGNTISVEKSIISMIGVQSMTADHSVQNEFNQVSGVLVKAVVPSEINAVAIDVTTGEYTRTTLARYRYRIVSANEQSSLQYVGNDWIDNGVSSKIIIPRTDGVIRVYAQAMSDDGTWSDVTAVVDITFVAPWWLSWKLWVGIAVLVILLVYGIFRIRVGQLQRRSQELETIVAMRTDELKRINTRFAEMIDELEAKQDELNARAKELERLNLEKNEILGIAAHDLKNPLRAISMTVNLIERKSVSLDEATSKRLRNIGSSAARMSSIIEKILTLNAVETGRYDLAPNTFDAVNSLSNLLEPYFTLAEAKDIALDFSSDIQAVQLHLNETAFLTVIDNIVSNALKYSPQSSAVNIRLTHTTTEERPSIFIAVQDQGPGFSDEDKRMMFQKFARLSAQPTGDEDSTGLGLSIVKTLVEAMEGRVWCESEQGKGALFVVEFPYVPDTHEVITPEQIVSRNSQEIL